MEEDSTQQEVLTSSDEQEERPEVKDLGVAYSDMQRMMGGDPIALGEQRLGNAQSRRTCLQSGGIWMPGISEKSRRKSFRRRLSMNGGINLLVLGNHTRCEIC